MTPDQLAVEADALLAGGRTPEEVARMQWLVTPEAESVLVKRLHDAAWEYGAREGMADYASDVMRGALLVIADRHAQGRPSLSDCPLLSLPESAGGASAHRLGPETP